MSEAVANVRVPVLFAIRDARGLNEHEKMFLLTVELRGVMKTSWATAAADMSMTQSKFYRTRKSLIDRDMVRAFPQANGATWYTVNAEALGELSAYSHSENTSHSGNEGSHSGNEGSHSENQGFHHAQQKGTSKKIKEEDHKTEEDQAPSGGKQGKQEYSMDDLIKTYGRGKVREAQDMIGGKNRDNPKFVARYLRGATLRAVV